MKESSYWQCPECSACYEDTYLLELTQCLECNEKVSPLHNRVTWEEFAAWCKQLKEEA